MPSSCDSSSSQSQAQSTAIQSRSPENPADIVAQDGKTKLHSDLLGRYTVLRELGRGAFGYVYEVFDKVEKTKLAVKVADNPSVALEAQTYNMIHLNGKKTGVPYVHLHDSTTYLGISKSLLFLDMLGPSLKKLREDLGEELSLKTVMMTAIQLLDRLEEIHERGFLHRDIKPGNILIGNEDPSTIYLVDFGCAKEYVDIDGTLLEPEKPFTTYGTAIYMSRNSGSYVAQSRRDDLESLGYVIVRLLTGNLPWNIEITEQTDLFAYTQRVQKKKVKTTMRQLLRGLPVELASYFKVVRRMRFEEKPDYDYLRSIFLEILSANNFSDDRVFDRTRKKRKAPSK